MPVLPNHRHELFAQGLAKGKTQRDAYVEAGYKFDEPNASRLTSNDKVRARVSELQERVAIRAEITVESLIAELEDIRSKALAAGQFASAVSAIKEKAILAGVRVEKRETTSKRNAAEMSDDELADYIERSSDRASASKGDPSQLN